MIFILLAINIILVNPSIVQWIKTLVNTGKKWFHCWTKKTLYQLIKILLFMFFEKPMKRKRKTQGKKKSDHNLFLHKNHILRQREAIMGIWLDQFDGSWWRGTKARGGTHRVSQKSQWTKWFDSGRFLLGDTNIGKLSTLSTPCRFTIHRILFFFFFFFSSSFLICKKLKTPKKNNFFLFS